MNNLHSLLRRQIKKHFGSYEQIPVEFHKFLDSIDTAYNQFDQDRKMLERSLELSSQELLNANSEMRAIFMAFPDLLFRIDKDGRILDIKTSKKVNLILETEKMIGKKIQNLPYTNVKVKFENAINNVIQNKEISCVEYCLNIDNKEKYFEARFVHFTKEQLVVIIRDITERKYAEDALRESENKFRSLTETLTSAVFVYRDKFIYTNDACEKLTGYSNEELLKIEFWKLVHPDYQELVKERGLARQRGIDIFSYYEFPIIRKDGKCCWIDFSASFIRYEGLSATLGTAFDITDRKIAEEAIKESEKKFKTLVESSIDIIFTLDLEGKFTYINPTFRKVTGMDSVKFITHSFHEIFSENYFDLTNEIFQIGLTGEKIYFYEIDILDNDGDKIPVELNIVALFNISGQTTGILGIARDISDRKYLESQLLQSQKMDAIGQLAGGIAHDFNNILTSILGVSEILHLKMDNKERLKNGLDQISKEAKRAASLAKQLLAFSRKEIIQLKALDLNITVNEMLNMLKRIIGENIDLQVSLRPDLFKILADQGQINQVILNLVVNAKDAMHNGGTIIIKTENTHFNHEDLKAHPYAAPGKFICLSVHDSGTGISEDILPNIFDPFFTTKGKEQGTGLGLAVVYGIIKQNQGWIDVKSRLGYGTIFRIYLPASKLEIGTEDEAKVLINNYQGNGRKVLLIEDEDGIREFAKEVLIDNGYVVLEAKSIKHAEEVFEKEKGNFHIIFSDVVLPDGSGMRLVEKFLSLNSKFNVLLTSGYTDDKSERLKISEKGYKFLQKPYTIVDLMESIL